MLPLFGQSVQRATGNVGRERGVQHIRKVSQTVDVAGGWYAP